MIGFLKKSIPLWPSYKTDRNILVIESDDWGTIRTSGLSSYKRLVSKGYPLNKNAYSMNDALERNQDLEGLLDVLSSVKNAQGQSPRITLNYITNNPDFEKIEESSFSKYYTLNSRDQRAEYADTDQLQNLYTEGIEKEIIKPQLHGREHLNVDRWLDGLKSKQSHLVDAFEEKMFSLCWQSPSVYPNEYMDALDFDSKQQMLNKRSLILEGADNFQKEWGFYSKSFIAPCYIWDSTVEETLKQKGVKYLQGRKIQLVPTESEGCRYKRRFHYTGQRNSLSQLYLVRNSFYEPTTYLNMDQVQMAMNQIDFAFEYKTPAILSTHRVNYIGRIFETNRSRGLKGLKFLLEQVVDKYPEVEFMFSDELGELIQRSK